MPASLQQQPNHTFCAELAWAFAKALVSSVPGIKFGLAFCEASGKCLIRWTGTDEAMIALAQQNAQTIGAGHTFILF